MKKKGFTLLELLIVIGILAILAGAMVPMFRYSRIQAQQNKAITDVEAIRTAAMMYNSDTGFWPRTGNTGPATNLTSNTWTVANWNGPYLAEWGNDPWNNAYAIFDSSATANSARWVQSLGPDGAAAPADLCTTLCSATVTADCDVCVQVTPADGTGSG